MTEKDKAKAKATAISEIESRIRTKEQAKQGFKRWLYGDLKLHKKLYSKEVLEFWQEVDKQVDLL